MYRFGSASVFQLALGAFSCIFEDVLPRHPLSVLLQVFAELMSEHHVEGSGGLLTPIILGAFARPAPATPAPPAADVATGGRGKYHGGGPHMEMPKFPLSGDKVFWGALSFALGVRRKDLKLTPATRYPLLTWLEVRNTVW